MPECAICGENEPGSKEDVLPNWLRKFAEAQSSENFVGIWGGPDYDAPRPGTILTRVGEPCNAWMNVAFEQPAQPLLEILMLGEAIHLSADDQRVLANWITKTALMTALHEGATPPKQLLREWRQSGEPPKGSRVSLACYSSPGEIPARGPLQVEVGEESRETGGVLSFLPFVPILGRLIPLFILVLNGPELRSVAEREGFATQIWPPLMDPASWPPARVDSRSVAALIDSWETVPSRGSGP
jgi:hypothetical protein